MRLLWKIVKMIFGSLFLAIVVVVGAPAAFGVTVLAGLIFLPLPATIPIPKPNPTILPTVLYDRYGHQIATLQQYDRNVPVTEAQIPQVLKEAVIADEDRNFYHHGGVDVRGTLRALYDDVRHKGPLQGGSTITQQYVKLAFTNQQRTLVRKVREAILASQLDREASKNEILYRYLTIVYFGDGNYGIGAAAENYFHVPVSALNASQAATLAGLIPAPSARAPRENLAAAEANRQLVLKEMHQQGYLTTSQYQTALAQRLALANGHTLPRPATVIYPLEVTTTAYPDFVDYVTRWLLAHFPASEVYGGGLRVQTTLDPAVQAAAYAAVRSTLSGTRPPLDMALAAVEPSTGFVPALVGGRGFGSTTQVNLALGGCDPKPSKGAVVQVAATCWSGQTITGGGEGRQPGSAWKPFTLATAFEQGIQPSAAYPAPGVYAIPGCQVPRGQPASACQIHNDEPGSILGTETLSQATTESTNTVYAQVAAQVGCNHVAATAKTLGVESAYYSTPPFYYCQSYALGEVDVSPLDMASAYGVFADHGQRATPTPVLEIVTSAGKVLVNNISPLPKTATALPANVADNVTSVLQGVIADGTGTAAQLGRPAAGKTGTTSNYTNAWFVGYTPTLSTAVWMGNASSQATPIGAVKGFNPVYGGTWPALTWRNFMTTALAGVAATPFTEPAPIIPPHPASALHAAPPTTLPIEPGPPGVVQGTPPGGPYQVPPPTFGAPEPVTTTVPPTTTTVPPATTTPTTAPPGGGSTTTTTTAGATPP
jgi:penicillin-binding protein 1A